MGSRTEPDLDDHYDFAHYHIQRHVRACQAWFQIRPCLQTIDYVNCQQLCRTCTSCCWPWAKLHAPLCRGLDLGLRFRIRGIHPDVQHFSPDFRLAVPLTFNRHSSDDERWTNIREGRVHARFVWMVAYELKHYLSLSTSLCFHPIRQRSLLKFQWMHII